MKTVLFILTVCLFLSACKKESFITGGDARLSLSADTLRFDTVFTSVGSVTQFFKIRNDNNQKLALSHVKISGGQDSFFRINVDGISGPEVNHIEIEANDSIYVFVSVSIDNNTSREPFLISDSIEIGYNGNVRYVQLESWGQNANFIRSARITGTVTWTNELPYVIIGGLQVDTTAKLVIEEGCRIYLHADAPLIVDGTLEVNGTAADSTRVHFQSDRLDDPYRRFPGGWPGIFFRGTSRNNTLNYAVIENAYQGIIAEQLPPGSAAKVTLNQCIINNIYDAGILGVQTSIEANNCLVSNCGKNVQLVYGGDYRFTHCTLAAFPGNYLSHTEPVLLVTDFIKQDNTIHTSDMKARFLNCIFWGEGGTVDDEVVTAREGSGSFDVRFDNSIWKVKTAPAHVTASGMIPNEDPLFDSLNTQKAFFDFHLKENSPAIDKGATSGLAVDLDGMQRTVALPDLGAYERQ